MHEYLENKTQTAGDSFSDSDIREFEMAKIRRPYIVNGVIVWIVGNSEQEIADKYADLKNGSVPLPQPKKPKHNFAKFAKDNWQYITQTVLELTARDYADTMNVHILPHFGNMNIEDITWRDVQRFYNKYQDRAFSTLNRWHVILSRILKIAVGDEIIPIDPTKDSRLTHSRKRTKRPVPTKQEFKQILDEIPNLKRQHEMLYMALVCYTGLRKGEVLALRWDDIDFVNDKIHITKATQTRKTSMKNPGKIQAPKSEAGKRTVPLVEPLKKILLNNRHQYEFIVTHPKTKEPINTEGKFVGMWQGIARQIDLGEYTSHSFRHAVCSTLLSSGVDIKTTQTIIGHSSASTTLDIYGHAMPDKVSEAGLILAENFTN